MPSLRQLIPAGAGAGEGYINVVSSNPITLVAFGFNGGADVVNVALRYYQPPNLTPGDPAGDYVDCWRCGQQVQVRADNNPVTVYGPGFFKVYKNTAEAVGVAYWMEP